MTKHLRTVVLGLTLTLAGISPSSAALYYNSTANPGWNAANGWSTTSGGPTYSTWSPDGSSAIFESGSPQTVIIGGSYAVGALTNSTGNLITFAKGSGGQDTLTFSGGAINGNFTFSTRSTITGNFEVQSGTVGLAGSTVSAIVGTVTVSGGTLDVSQPGNLGSSTNVTVTGGLARIGVSNTSASMGALTINSGTFELGRATVNSTALTIGSLSGSGGTFTARSSAANPSNSVVINQSSNTTFSGTLDGTNNTSVFSLTKSGAGDLTLAGSVTEMVKTTTVDGGRLYINGSTTSFGDNVGSTAISVASGGTLGGTGTITTLASDNVVVASGGALTAGLASTAGRTTYALGTGSQLDISAATAGSGWLKFELGSNGTAGTTYDQIRVSSGTLAIGSALLNFADFNFAALSGFGNGKYVLFENSALSGTLASTGLTGLISGLDATLAIEGNNIVLDVVPEPKVVALLAMSLGVLVFLQRARKRDQN